MAIDLEQLIEDQLEAGNDIAAGLFAIAWQLSDVAIHLKYLGNGNAASTMGAIEHLSLKISDAGDAIAMAIQGTTV